MIQDGELFCDELLIINYHNNYICDSTISLNHAMGEENPMVTYDFIEPFYPITSLIGGALTHLIILIHEININPLHWTLNSRLVNVHVLRPRRGRGEGPHSRWHYSSN